MKRFNNKYIGLLFLTLILFIFSGCAPVWLADPAPEPIVEVGGKEVKNDFEVFCWNDQGECRQEHKENIEEYPITVIANSSEIIFNFFDMHTQPDNIKITNMVTGEVIETSKVKEIKLKNLDKDQNEFIYNIHMFYDGNFKQTLGETIYRFKLVRE